MDINISNGTCYQFIDKAADARYLPCGNAGIETQSCCFEGDACLDAGACAGQRDGVNVTYVAGCTDPTFLSLYSSSRACAAKSSEDPWIAVALCADDPNVSSGSSNSSDVSYPWAACIIDDHPTTIDAAAAASCTCLPRIATTTVTETETTTSGSSISTSTLTTTSTTYRFVALNAESSLRTTAILPVTAGGVITWAAGFTPTTPAVTTTSDSGIHYTAPTYTAFSSSSGGGSHLSTANKIRIAVIIGSFAVVLAIIVYATMYERRQRTRRRIAAQRVVSASVARARVASVWPLQHHYDSTISLPKYTRNAGQDERDISMGVSAGSGGAPVASAGDALGLPAGHPIVPSEQPPAYTR